MNSLALPLCSTRPLTSAQPTPERLRRAVRRLASIHDGTKGQSIPHEVREFYKAVVRKDPARSAMIKDAVLDLERELRSPTVDWDAVRDRHQEGLIGRSILLSLWHRRKSAERDATREALVASMPGDTLERHRVAYVVEGMKVFEEVLRFALVLAEDNLDRAEVS